VPTHGVWRLEELGTGGVYVLATLEWPPFGSTDEGKAQNLIRDCGGIERYRVSWYSHILHPANRCPPLSNGYYPEGIGHQPREMETFTVLHYLDMLHPAYFAY